MQHLLEAVTQYHKENKFIEAADTLLESTLDLVEQKDWDNLNLLTELLEQDILLKPENYNDQGLARIINVLAVTRNHAFRLSHRAQLKTTYCDYLKKDHFESGAYDRAVLYL